MAHVDRGWARTAIRIVIIYTLGSTVLNRLIWAESWWRAFCFAAAGSLIVALAVVVELKRQRKQM